MLSNFTTIHNHPALSRCYVKAYSKAKATSGAEVGNFAIDEGREEELAFADSH